MAGNPENASIWTEADVYVTSDLDAPVPATTDEDFGSEWGLVGLLSGEDGFTHARSEDKTDHYAWGGILVYTSRKNFKASVKFSALEDNETTRSLVWPGSPAGKRIVPRPQPVKVALVKRMGTSKTEVLVTTRYAIVDLDGDVKEGEDDLTKYELLATIYPDANGSLWDEVPAGGESGN